MGLKNVDMGPTLRMLRTLSESPNDAAEPDQAPDAAPAVWAARPEVAAVAAESAPAFMQSPIAKQYREVSPQSMFCRHIAPGHPSLGQSPQASLLKQCALQLAALSHDPDLSDAGLFEGRQCSRMVARQTSPPLLGDVGFRQSSGVSPVMAVKAVSACSNAAPRCGGATASRPRLTTCAARPPRPAPPPRSCRPRSRCRPCVSLSCHGPAASHNGFWVLP